MIISKDRKLVVGLEIGTNKVVTLVGEILIDKKIKIIGIGICASHGINQGRINNLNAVVKCIQESVHKAETMANCHITSLYVSLSNKYIDCRNEIGITPISADEVTIEDLDNVIHTAKSVQILNEHYILHVIPQDYSIDQNSGIKNPIGLSGIRMQVNVHLITCHQNMAKNIIKAVEKCGLKVDKMIFSGLASSKSVLTEDECKLGVCMIDIGGGTMDFTIYIDGAIQDSQVIPYGGNIVTSDISYAFNTSYNDSEKIKIQYGCATKIPPGTSKNIDWTDINNNSQQTVQKDALIEVIESRYLELFKLVNHRILYIQKKLYQKGLKYHLSSGIVLTGGGSKMTYLTECAEKVFNKKIRIATPVNIAGLKENITEPDYSTVLGLLHYGRELYSNIENKKENSFIQQWFQKISNWFKKEF